MWRTPSSSSSSPFLLAPTTKKGGKESAGAAAVITTTAGASLPLLPMPPGCSSFQLAAATGSSFSFSNKDTAKDSSIARKAARRGTSCPIDPMRRTEGRLLATAAAMRQ